MAAMTATALAAVTTAAAKVVRKGSSFRCRLNTSLGFRMPNSDRAVDFAVQGAALFSSRNHVFYSFCTAPNANVEVTNPEETAVVNQTSPSAESSESKSESGEVNIKEAADLLDIRVGQVVKAWRHEEADSLYVEEVDVGEAEARIICSGLVNYIPLEQLQEKKVVVLANLKPRNMRGVKSSGMLMAASDASHENVELLEPPAGSVAGDRIWFGSQDDQINQTPPATPNQIQKKKIWETVQPHLKTDESCVAMLGEHSMRTSAGVVTCRSLKKANIS